MKEKIIKIIFTLISLFIVILLFAFFDYLIHDLKDDWGVPEYYFKNKIIYGFLWGLVGLLLTVKIKNIRLKSLIAAVVVSVALQVKYFLEGYPLDFVFIFLFIHFIILYFLLLGMFSLYQYANRPRN